MNALDTTAVAVGTTVAGHRFDLLFQTHYGRLARVVGRIVHDQARAEEIAADVFVRWRHHPAAHGEGAEGWLYRTAVRQALDAWRRGQRWARVQRVLVRLGVPPRTPEDLHAEDVERRQVRTVLAALPRRQATILLMWAEDSVTPRSRPPPGSSRRRSGPCCGGPRTRSRRSTRPDMDMHPENAWVVARLAALTPTWNPNPARARAAIDQATAPERRAPAYRLAAAAGGALLATVLLAPSGRALAQELWYRLFVSRLQVVRLDLSRVPLETKISTNGAEQSAASVAEASTIAGYTVELPPAAVLAGEPVLSVLQPVDLKQTIRRDTLSAALAAAGADDIDVPAEWDGVTLRGTIGRTVVARYLGPAGSGRRPDDVTILQTPPIRLDLPSGFPLDWFAEAVFRAGGLSWWEARTLGQDTRRTRRGCWTCRTTGRSRSRRCLWRAYGHRHRRSRRRSRRRDHRVRQPPVAPLRGEQPQPRNKPAGGGRPAVGG